MSCLLYLIVLSASTLILCNTTGATVLENKSTEIVNPISTVNEYDLGLEKDIEEVQLYVEKIAEDINGVDVELKYSNEENIILTDDNYRKTHYLFQVIFEPDEEVSFAADYLLMVDKEDAFGQVYCYWVDGEIEIYK